MKKLNCGIFPGKVWVFYGTKPTMVRCYLRAADFDEVLVQEFSDDACASCNGMMWSCGDNYVVWTKKKEIHALVHELTHTVFALLTNMGVPINRENDEVFCYTLDHLVSCALAK